MSLHFSEATHQALLAKVPSVTGRELPEWYREIDDGPCFSRFEDRVHWLQDEHSIAHGHATAIAREHHRLRVSRGQH
ncbi:DUF4287 domain-containing protein [Yinghuangia seranimata]|uniref:DUF4287 domain-containing protein n=1 Tax=Yinghuangia seranimata TaxID=408067 RepID=UPI00248C2161|nr:DUF4287 domain-containing protein [Yinghuangia seranimata]MDI2128804.1 DUF4287 domain-containing protein [Yinghuangia seranimata]